MGAQSVPGGKRPRFGGNFAESVVAFGDQFVVAGVDDGHATTWVTSDGTSWTKAALPDGIVDGTQISTVHSLATANSRLVALGSIQPFGQDQAGIGWNSETGLIPPTGVARAVAWVSDDAQTWIRADLPDPGGREYQLASGLAGGSDGFVGFTSFFDGKGMAQAVAVSNDGVNWSVAPTSLEGPRTAITEFDGRWTAIGKDVDYFKIGPETGTLQRLPQSATVWTAS